nr:uncharacterized protein LOC117455042 isoform X2 [Pseudochaenichthys georgianus]
MVSNPHLSAALTCVAIRRLLAGAMARSNRRRRRLRRILAMCQWQGGKGLYMQLNATAPILTVYANPEACLKKEFRVKRSSVVYLVQMLSSPKDHGWGQDIEVLVLLCGGFSIRDSQIDGPQDHQTRHREDKGQPEDPHFPANRR